MESSETREPSYYEVALTNRQVLVAFVVLLTCLLGAFLSGVWVGRGGAPTSSPPVQAARPSTAEPVEQLTFFSGREPGERSGERPARAVPAPAPSAAPKPEATAPTEDPATEQMRRTLEAEMAANRQVAAEPPAQAAGETAPTTGAEAPTAGARRTRNPAPAATVEPRPTERPARVARTGSFWVQVYSSANGERAREIVAQLERAKFPVVLAELERAGGTNFRVRVGPFDARPQAESAATRLRREQKLDTWITDTP